MPETENRIQLLENNHNLLSSELKQTNETLREIKTAIEKQNEIHTDIRLLTQKFDSHIESHKRDDEKINELKEQQENGIRPDTLKNLLIYAAIVIITYGSFLTMFIFALDKSFSNHIVSDTIREKIIDNELKKNEDKSSDNKNQITYLKGRIKE